MPCPHCPATATTEQPRPTALGYRTFRCSRCRRVCNERTSTACNHRQCPTDRVLLVVLWRLRYKLRLRDLSEMFLVRGFVFSHEAVRDWEARFAPLLTEWLRAKRRGGGTTQWHADETYLRVGGRWCSLYRAIDRDGNLYRGAAERATRQGRGPAVLRRGPGCRWPRPRAGDDGRARRLPACHPRDARAVGPAPHQPRQKYPDRAGPPRHQATLLSAARLRYV